MEGLIHCSSLVVIQSKAPKMSLCKAKRDLQPNIYDLTAYKCMQSLLYS